MNLRTELLNLLELAYEEERIFASVVSQVERHTSGSYAQWSIKDVIAHVAAWRHRTAQELAAAAFGTDRPEGDNLEQINVAIFEQHHHCPWGDVVRYSEMAYEALCELVKTIPEDILLSVQAIEWYKGPVWRLALDDGYSHPHLHLYECYERRGAVDRAADVQKEAARRRKQFIASVKGAGIGA